MIAWFTESLASLALAPGALAAVMAVVFAASVLRGITGFGFAIAAVPLLGLLMSPTQAVALGRGVTLAAFPGSAATLVAGLTAGLFNGLAAMPGPPAVAYYLAAPVQRIAARASILVFFLATSVPALASAAFVGLLDVGSLVLSVVSLPVMVAGTIAGDKAGTKGSDRLHRALSIALLVAIALTSIGKGAIELIGGRG